jgi:hypothetical protein
MKKFLLGLLALVSVAAYGTLPETDKAILMSSNMVNNPGFESGTAGWTASGGTFTASATAKGLGGLGGSWDSSAAAQTLRSKLMPIPNGLKGKNSVVSCAIKTVAGAATHKLQAFDGTNIVAEGATTYSTTSFARTTINFVAPSSGNLAVQLTSVAADEPTIYIDDCTISLADGYNLSQINQASFYGSMEIGGNGDCAFSRLATSFGSYSAYTNCPSAVFEGSATTPGSKIPAITFNDMPPGEYYFVATGSFVSNGAGTSFSHFRFYDGSNAFGNTQVYLTSGAEIGSITGRINYTTAGTRTIEIQGYRDASNNATYSGDGEPLRILVYRFPTYSETAYRADLGPSSWSGYHGPDCQWSRASSSFGNMTADATCTFTENSNTNFGVVTSALVTDKIPGIVFTPQRAGQYFVCATTPTYNSTADYTGTRLTDGTSVLVSQNKYFANTSSVTVPVAHCGIYNATSTAQVTLRLEGYANTGTLQMGANADTTTHSVDWSIISMSQSFPAPVFVGSVTSASAGAIRIESVRFGTGDEVTPCSSSPCTQYGASSAWVTSIVRNATGDYSFNISTGTFSAAPTCVYTMGNNAANAVARFDIVPTATSWNLITKTLVGTAADAAGNVICMGPK